MLLRPLVRRSVLEKLRTSGPMTILDISVQLDTTRQAVMNAIHRLRGDGYVEIATERIRSFNGLGRGSASFRVTAAGRTCALEKRQYRSKEPPKKVRVTRADYERYHAGHVRRQKIMGVPEALIEEDLYARASTVA